MGEAILSFLNVKKCVVLLFCLNFALMLVLYRFGDWTTIDLSAKGQLTAAAFSAVIASILVSIKGFWGLIFRVIVIVTYSLLLSSVISIQSLPNDLIIASFFEASSAELFSILKHMHFSPIILSVLIFTLLRAFSKRANQLPLNYKTVLLLFTLNLFPFGLYLTEPSKSYPFLQSVSGASIPQRLSMLQNDFLRLSTHIYKKNIFTFLPIPTIRYFFERSKISVYQNTKRTLPSNLNLSKNNLNQNTPRKVIIIIGESAAKKHYQTYGYPHNTDDFLFTLTKNTDISYIVSDAISPASITRESIPRQITFATPKNYDNYFKYLNAVELAENANYETAWISNQRAIGSNDTAIGAIASTSSYQSFIQQGDFYASENLDIESIVPLKQLLLKDSSYQFFVIHLMGSHLAYDDKYDDKDWKAAQGSPEEYREYDATVHHTDKVIKAVYKELEPLNNSIIIYMPDHGEIVNIGHGLNVLNRMQFEVPLIAIGHPPHVNTFKKLVVNLSDKNGTFNTSNMIYVLGALMGYQFTDDAIKNAVKDGEHIYHVDKSTYPVNALH